MPCSATVLVRRCVAIALFVALATQLAAAQPAAVSAPEKINIGIIGLDTSHAIAFTQLLNSEASPASRERLPGRRSLSVWQSRYCVEQESDSTVYRANPEVGC